MARSECFCSGHSCEPCLNKVDSGGYETALDKRFRFDKIDNCIVGGGIVGGSIGDCEIRLAREKREEIKNLAEKTSEEKEVKKKSKSKPKLKEKPRIVKRDPRVDFSYNYSF